MSEFAILRLWADSLPEGFGANCEPLSFSVPYPIDDRAAEEAARKLASAYMRSALADISKSGAKVCWAVRLSEQVTIVEKPFDNFWRRVARPGWAFYTIRCRVGCVPASAEAMGEAPSLTST